MLEAKALLYEKMAKGEIEGNRKNSDINNNNNNNKKIIILIIMITIV